MGRGVRAKYDALIDVLIADPNYDVREDGTIWTRVQRNGRPGETWRNAGRTDKEGYRELHYKQARLKIHRVVYRKFKGALDPYKVVDHRDRCPGNNRPDNLGHVTVKSNNQYRYRREERSQPQKEAA